MKFEWGENMKHEWYEYSVKIDNEFFDKYFCKNKNDSSEKKIINKKIDELLLYYVLNRMIIGMSNIVMCNVGLLSDLVCLDKKNNIEKIHDALCGLQKKGFIEMRFISSNQKKDYHRPLEIVFLKNNPVTYTNLNHWMFEMADDAKEFFVFAYIEKWKNSNHKISLSEWASQMGYTVNGVELLLRRMEEKKKIKIVSGKYSVDEGNRQGVNTYVVSEEIVDTAIGEIPISELIEFCKNSHWGKKNEYGVYEELRYYDYELYRSCKELGINQPFVVKCERIMRKMNKDIFEEWERRYEQENKKCERTA